EAPYFVDLVHDQLVQRIGDQDLSHQSLRIYTSLDPELQRAASEAVEIGMRNVDELVRKLHKTPKGQTPGPITYPQVALIAIDPHTGQVLALVGGRNYGFSQLNHAVAKRPTGSIFKPFVYAAAINTGLDGSNPVLTAASMVADQPNTFAYGDQIYEPRNYKEEYHGEVTLRYALAMSLNNATVKLAEQVGYEKVADLAKAAGIASVKATPAMALVAYDASDRRLSAAQAAAAIWAEFMKKAVALPQYSDAKPFNQPSGIVDVQLDKQTNLLATPACPETYSAAFIAGTEPSQTCDEGTGIRGFFSRIFGTGGDKALPPPPP